MKKRLFFSAQVVFLTLFIFSLLVLIFQLSGRFNPLTRFDHDTPVYNNIEAYDPSLIKLNSLKKIEQYCDSIYAQKAFAEKPAEFESEYTDIVSSVIRNRFYHGYSYYGFNDNYIAALSGKMLVPGWSALVIPDEILKYPYAACSQQSIVMMEALESKGLKTRKVSFSGKVFGGHFAFEVFYNGKWHFHDPNLEPDLDVLNKYNRPGIDFLAHNPEVLLSAYNRYPKDRILDIFPNYSYGPVNKFPAPKALIFQKATQVLSYTIWLFFLVAFIITRRKYLRLRGNSHGMDESFAMSRIQPDQSIYYPDYTAQRV